MWKGGTNQIQVFIWDVTALIQVPVPLSVAQEHGLLFHIFWPDPVVS